MKSVANPLSLISFIVDLKLFFIYFNVLKHLSLEAVVTGKVANILNSTSRLGYVLILLQAFSVSIIVLGGFSASFHTCCHLQISASTSSISPGKWCPYNLTQSLKFWSQVSFVAENDTLFPGIKKRKRCHVDFCLINLSWNWNITVSRYG